MSDRSMPARLEALASGVRLGKFVSVGAVGAVFDNTVLTLLQLGTGLPTILAKVAGAETAIVVMFLLNEHWTFSDEGAAGRGPFLRRLLRSHLVRAGGTSLQLVLFSVLYYGLDVTVRLSTLRVELLGVDLAQVDFWFLVASVTAIGVAMVVNYAFETLFTWKVHR